MLPHRGENLVLSVGQKGARLPDVRPGTVLLLHRSAPYATVTTPWPAHPGQLGADTERPVPLQFWKYSSSYLGCTGGSVFSLLHEEHLSPVTRRGSDFFRLLGSREPPPCMEDERGIVGRPLVEP